MRGICVCIELAVIPTLVLSPNSGLIHCRPSHSYNRVSTESDGSTSAGSSCGLDRLGSARPSRVPSVVSHRTLPGTDRNGIGESCSMFVFSYDR